MATPIQTRIIETLYIHTYFDARHTSTKNATKGIKKDQQDKADKELKELRKQGIIIFHPTSHGMQVSLNSEQLREIKKILNIP